MAKTIRLKPISWCARTSILDKNLRLMKTLFFSSPMADDDEEVIVKEGSVWKQGRGMISKSWAERYLIVGAEVGLSLAALSIVLPTSNLPIPVVTCSPFSVPRHLSSRNTSTASSRARSRDSGITRFLSITGTA